MNSKVKIIKDEEAIFPNIEPDIKDNPKEPILLEAYAVYDKVSDGYDVPFFSRNEVFAKRKFIMDCQNRAQNTMISNFKNDFELHFIGSFNQRNGRFEESVPVAILKGEEIEVRNA